MSYTVPAVFESGVFRPLAPVELEEGTQVEVQMPRAANSACAGLSLEEGKVIAQQAAAMSWDEFVEQTYGSCAGLGLERHEQGSFEVREPIA